MPVKLKNLTKRMVTFNLPHDVVCTEQQCLCSRRVTGVQQHDPATGEKTVQAFKKRLADSVTLTAAGTEGDTVEGLPDGVFNVPEIRAAQRTVPPTIELTRSEVQKSAPAPTSNQPAPKAEQE